MVDAYPPRLEGENYPLLHGESGRRDLQGEGDSVTTDVADLPFAGGIGTG